MSRVFRRTSTVCSAGRLAEAGQCARVSWTTALDGASPTLRKCHVYGGTFAALARLSRRHASVTERSMGDASNRQLQHLRRYLRSLGLAHRRAHPRGGREETRGGASVLRARSFSKKRACASRTSTLPLLGTCAGERKRRRDTDDCPTPLRQRAIQACDRGKKVRRSLLPKACRRLLAGSSCPLVGCGDVQEQ